VFYISSSTSQAVINTTIPAAVASASTLALPAFPPTRTYAADVATQVCTAVLHQHSNTSDSLSRVWVGLQARLQTVCGGGGGTRSSLTPTPLTHPTSLTPRYSGAPARPLRVRLLEALQFGFHVLQYKHYELDNMTEAFGKLAF
jgi:hypothetical protein